MSLTRPSDIGVWANPSLLSAMPSRYCGSLCGSTLSNELQNGLIPCAGVGASDKVPRPKPKPFVERSSCTKESVVPETSARRQACVRPDVQCASPPGQEGSLV